jgi:hypothetical protein
MAIAQCFELRWKIGLICWNAAPVLHSDWLVKCRKPIKCEHSKAQKHAPSTIHTKLRSNDRF